MDFTDRCYYCCNSINSITGYGEDECHIVTGDLKVCNNLIQYKCMPFHPLGKMLYAIEEDMLDITNEKDKKLLEMVIINKSNQYDFIKSKILQTIFKLNIDDKVIRYFDDNLNIRNVINSNKQLIKNTVLDRLAIFLEYYNINKNFIKKIISFFSKFNKVITFNESYNKTNIDILILKDNKIVKFKLPKSYDSKKSCTNLLATNSLLYS